MPTCGFPPRAKSSSIPKIPDLASSVETVSSQEFDDGDDEQTQVLESGVVRPELITLDSCENRSRGREKHITPIDLEKIVVSMKQKKELGPLSPSMLPLPALTEAEEMSRQEPSPETTSPTVAQSATSSLPADHSSHQQTLPSLNKDDLESSASTVAMSNSDTSRADHRSSDSSQTAMSTHNTHNVVRGFVPGGAPSSYRSQTQLAATPAPILKNSPRNVNLPRRSRGPMFTLGGSSGDDDSSLDSHMHKSSLSQGLHRQTKQASFREDNLVTKVQDSPVFESDEEDDEDVSEGVIEDDEDSSDWEDEGDDDKSDLDEPELFHRVDSRPNLTSRRSLLTSQLHEGDRAKALANAASRSTPAIRRSRAASPSGPSHTAEHQREIQRAPQNPHPSGGRPINFPTSSSTQQLALSPRTTRRNMLSTELTESLRKNLLWERQHKSSSNIAALKRRHTSMDMKNLRQYPDPQPATSHKENNSKTYNNDYFHAGLQEYHAKGW